MSITLDRKNYEDCFGYFDRALQAEWGIRVQMQSHSAAHQYRFRMNKARQLDRQLNRQRFADDPEHPLYGRSEYGAIVMRIKYDEERDQWFLYLEKTAVIEAYIEELPPPEGFEELEERAE